MKLRSEEKTKICKNGMVEGKKKDAVVERYEEPISDEQAFEMRAAFGPNVKVVNVLTGRVHIT